MSCDSDKSGYYCVLGSCWVYLLFWKWKFTHRSEIMIMIITFQSQASSSSGPRDCWSQIKKKKNPWATSVSSRFFSDWGKGFSYLSSTYSNCRRGRAREFHMVIFAVSLFKCIEWHQKFPGSLTMRDTITMIFSFRRTSFRLHNVHLENILVMV